MAGGYCKGDKVRWNWAAGSATGTIAARFERRVLKRGSELSEA